jgi:RNA polymerase sigma factor (sigma-70 family)
VNAGMPELVDHLFRHEAGKITARLTRRFGPYRWDLAEEAVQEAMCAALETWKFYGAPADPGAWLMRVAQNRVIDRVRRERRLRGLIDEATVREGEAAFESQIASLEKSDPHDDCLVLMLSCCHPRLSLQAQVALILKTLCGFSAGEIATALFATEQGVAKRIVRAKELLKQSGSLVTLENRSQIRKRRSAVHQAIYLMFSEGYHSLRVEAPVRRELCTEAIRLALLLCADPATHAPDTDALLALMYFGLARLAARVDQEGVFLPLSQQDRSLWDHRLIAVGFRYFDAATSGSELTTFHIEAAIAAQHCRARTLEEIDWRGILELYELLAQLSASPIVALNHAITLGQCMGPDAGLSALRAIAPTGSLLEQYPFFHAAVGEFHDRNRQFADAEAAFERAERLARSPAERQCFTRKVLNIRQRRNEEFLHG